MHDTAYRVGGRFLESYLDLADCDVLEIGALIVNGTLRDHALPTTRWVGIDLVPGPGVDIVAQPGEALPVPDSAFDAVVASSVFEHDPAFWETFLEMADKVRPGGYVYINAPSNGGIHRYPQDNWRFYPDSGRALAAWAQRKGRDISLVESFVAARGQKEWNDFVAVFRRGQPAPDHAMRLLHTQVDCVNVSTWSEPGLVRPVAITEDMQLLDEARSECAHAKSAASESDARAALAIGGLEAKVAQIEAQFRAAEKSRASAETLLSAERAERRALAAAVETAQAEKALLREQLAKSAEEQAEIEGNLACIRAELGNTEHELSATRSTLRQREEELSQLLAELQRSLAERDCLLDRLAKMDTAARRMEEKLSEAEGWVFRLAAERTAREREMAVAERALRRERKERARADWLWTTLAHDAQRLSERLVEVEDSSRQAQSRLEQALADATTALTHLKEERAAQLRSAQGKTEAEREARLSLARQLEEEVHRRQRELTLQQAELSKERETRRAAEATIRETEAQLSTVRQSLAKVREDALAETSRIKGEQATAARILAARSEEIVALTKLLANAERPAAPPPQLPTVATMLAEVVGEALMATQPRIGLPFVRRNVSSRLRTTLRQKGLFDAEAYLRANPDVAAAGQDALHHYLIHGLKEGRLFGSSATGDGH